MQSFMVMLLICSVTLTVIALFYMAVTPLLVKRYSVKRLLLRMARPCGWAADTFSAAVSQCSYQSGYAKQYSSAYHQNRERVSCCLSHPLLTMCSQLLYPVSHCGRLWRQYG